jgi:TfoX/Sxy family transcriptional regulator of competence genes
MPTPDFAKSPPALVERFDAVAAEFPAVERRLTFGYPCLYVGGNMASGLHQSAWFVRLGDTEHARALTDQGGAPFEPMPGRPMTGYTLLPAEVIADHAATKRWVQRAIEYVGTLPPKVPKAKSKPKAKVG